MLFFLLKLAVVSLKGGEIFCALCSGWGGGKETAGNILVNFCAQMLENVSCKHRFLAAAVTGFTGSSTKNILSEEHKDGFYLPHHVCVISATSRKKNIIGIRVGNLC